MGHGKLTLVRAPQPTATVLLMGAPAKRHATYEDLLAAPEHLVAEIIHGVLVTHPRRATRSPRPSSAAS